MKKVEVKLYYYHDIDLISLYRSECVNFPDATKKALKAYAEGKAYKIKVGEKKEKRTHEIYKKCFHYYITLYEGKDDEIIDLLKNVSFGYRNNFIKTILRHYIGCELTAEYLVNEDQKYLDDRAQILAAGKEILDIKRVRKTKEKEETIQKSEEKDEDVGWKEEEKAVEKEEGGYTASANNEDTDGLGDLLSELTEQY